MLLFLVGVAMAVRGAVAEFNLSFEATSPITWFSNQLVQSQSGESVIYDSSEPFVDEMGGQLYFPYSGGFPQHECRRIRGRR
jgi:hypothetical protein